VPLLDSSGVGYCCGLPPAGIKSTEGRSFTNSSFLFIVFEAMLAFIRRQLLLLQTSLAAFPAAAPPDSVLFSGGKKTPQNQTMTSTYNNE
jgi:hypothetical protein